jgi:hypothetical protein
MPLPNKRGLSMDAFCLSPQRTPSGSVPSMPSAFPTIATSTSLQSLELASLMSQVLQFPVQIKSTLHSLSHHTHTPAYLTHPCLHISQCSVNVEPLKNQLADLDLIWLQYRDEMLDKVQHTLLLTLPSPTSPHTYRTNPGSRRSGESENRWTSKQPPQRSPARPQASARYINLTPFWSHLTIYEQTPPSARITGSCCASLTMWRIS